MKRLGLSVLVALMLLATTGTAGAGWGYWSPSTCRADIDWYRSSAGVYYWQYGYSETHGAHLVPETYYRQVYESRGWECGWMGAPLDNKHWTGDHWVQSFEGGQISSNF